MTAEAALIIVFPFMLGQNMEQNTSEKKMKAAEFTNRYALLS